MHVEQSLNRKGQMEGQRPHEKIAQDAQGQMPAAGGVQYARQSLKATIEKLVTWYNEERIHYALSGDTPAQWYRSIVCEAACPSMVLPGREGIQKRSGFPCLTGSTTSRIRPQVFFSTVAFCHR